MMRKTTCGLLESKTLLNGAVTGAYYYTYDGNGNVQQIVDAASGSVVAEYEYGPFGELVRATGPQATANPIRFSTTAGRAAAVGVTAVAAR